ncbi:MAG: hypothetical protein IKH75_10285 [Ruminococcus sp.]|nr:hypothetical protein [Ruminococcus sp.]
MVDQFEILFRQGANTTQFYLGAVPVEEAMEKAAWLMKAAIEYGEPCAVTIEVKNDD